MAIMAIRTKRLTGLFIFASIMGLLALAIGCAGSLAGSGKLETWDMDYRDFTVLDVGSTFEVDVIRGDSYRVTITADDNFLQSLDIEKIGDTLHVGLKELALPVDATLKAEIIMPDLRRLNLSGASKAGVNGFSSTNRLELDISGTSSLIVSNLEAGDTEIHVSGASDVSGDIKAANCDFTLSKGSIVDLKGSARDVSIQASNASRVILGDFTVVDAKVNLSGATYATVNARGGIDVALSGVSELEYAGDAKLGDINISCASDIVKNEQEG